MAISNTNIVKKRIQNHIRSYMGIRELKNNVNALMDRRSVFTPYKAGEKMVEGGMFSVYYSDVQNVLNNKFKINPQNKKYSFDYSWKIYKGLMAREIANIYSGKIYK